jgi:hypothetical protein
VRNSPRRWTSEAHAIPHDSIATTIQKHDDTAFDAYGTSSGGFIVKLVTIVSFKAHSIRLLARLCRSG